MSDQPPPYQAPQTYDPAYGQPAAAPYAGYQGAGQPGPPVKQGTNGFAIASLIFGILGGVLLSVIFGFVALSQIRKRGQSGRGLAITGLVLSGTWILVIAAAAAFAIISDAGNDTPGPAGSRNGAVSVTKIKPGDCLKDVKEAGSVENVPLVACSQSHNGEVYAVFDLPSGAWPGDAAVQTKAESGCKTRFGGYSKVAEDDVEILYLHPLEASWSLDRGVTCIATDPKGPRTGSIKK